MSTGWIAIDKTLPYKPEVTTLCRRLSMSRADVVLACVMLWAWADDLTIDGDLGEQTLEVIDMATHISGFGQALLDIGWLEFREEHMWLPNWTKWNTRSAKARITAARRNSLMRQRRKE